MANPLFQDTSILVDRVLCKHNAVRIGAIEAMLRQYDFKMACGYSRLEYKRVLLQNFSLLLTYLTERRSFLHAFERANRNFMRPRKVSTLISILVWTGYDVNSGLQVSVGDEVDSIQAERAIAYLRNAIRTVWMTFPKLMDARPAEGTACRRAQEGPTARRDGSFDTSIRQSACRSRQCNNANFFLSRRADVRKVVIALERLGDAALTGELKNILKTAKRALQNANLLYDYTTCMALGDLWVHLESVAAGVTHFATTNVKESARLCPTLSLTMVNPQP